MGGDALDDAWEAALGRLKADDFLSAKEHLQTLVRHMHSDGIPNLSVPADIVLHHALRAADTGNTSIALELADLAAEMAPNSANVPRIMVRLHI